MELKVSDRVKLSKESKFYEQSLDYDGEEMIGIVTEIITLYPQWVLLIWSNGKEASYRKKELIKEIKKTKRIKLEL